MNYLVKQYIIDAIDTENYGVTATTEQEKLQFLYDTFVSEKGHYEGRNQRVFSEWLRGLPSSFNIAFTNSDIINAARAIKLFHGNTGDAIIIEMWWIYIATEVFLLFKQHKCASTYDTTTAPGGNS